MAIELTNSQRMLINAIENNDQTTDVLIARGMSPYELYRLPKIFLDSRNEHQPYDEIAKQFTGISSRVDELLMILHFK